MNILCCLVHPVGEYLSYPICDPHRQVLGLAERSVYSSSSRMQYYWAPTDDDSNVDRHTRDRQINTWVAGHRRAQGDL